MTDPMSSAPLVQMPCARAAARRLDGGDAGSQSGTLEAMDPGAGGLATLIVAIDHVGLAVPDLQAAIALHTGVLGLQLLHREDNREQGVAEAMLAPYGAAAAGVQVQLLAPLDDVSPLARFLGRSGPGLHHLAYRVSDVEAASAELRRSGVRLLYDAPRSGTRGSRINFTHPKDMGGVLVELVQAD
jgi:methylmalonyl-CoA/ethylmalonyl-CoA epimerase